jgi:hypothetical protein
MNSFVSNCGRLYDVQSFLVVVSTGHKLGKPVWKRVSKLSIDEIKICADTL